MLTEKCVKHVGHIFRWRKLICAAVKAEHEKEQAKIEPGMPKSKSVAEADPTANQAIRNLSRLDVVCIRPKRGGRAVYIQDPETWLEIIDATYETYGTSAPKTQLAMKELFERGVSGEALAGLMGISKRVFYDKRRRFLVEAAFNAARHGLLPGQKHE